jgi:hypothetical protein
MTRKRPPETQVRVVGSRYAEMTAEGRRRHANATAALRRSPLRCVWCRTPAGRAITTALADVPRLCDRIDRLDGVRRSHEDLKAAAQATLAAYAEGEADPLYYLRDELRARSVWPGEGEARPW